MFEMLMTVMCSFFEVWEDVEVQLISSCDNKF